MSVKKSLVCTISEATDDVQDALSIRTTETDAIILDVLVDIKRFAINANDLTEALQSVREFNLGNKNEGHSTTHISNVDDIPELMVMSLDNIQEKVVDDEIPF
jgi:hypothetical protein